MLKTLITVAALTVLALTLGAGLARTSGAALRASSELPSCDSPIVNARGRAEVLRSIECR